MKRIIVLEAFKRNYRGDPEKDAHCPYSNRLHDPETDEQVPWRDLIYDAMYQVPEGNIVRIVIEDTEEKSDYAEDWWCLLSPHNYGPHSAIEVDDERTTKNPE